MYHVEISPCSFPLPPPPPCCGIFSLFAGNKSRKLPLTRAQIPKHHLVRKAGLMYMGRGGEGSGMRFVSKFYTGVIRSNLIFIRMKNLKRISELRPCCPDSYTAQTSPRHQHLLVNPTNIARDEMSMLLFNISKQSQVINEQRPLQPAAPNPSSVVLCTNISKIDGTCCQKN